MTTLRCCWNIYIGCVYMNELHNKLCVLVYNCLHSSAPRYLQEVIQPVAEVTSRRRLRSSSSFALLVPVTRRTTLGDQAFAVAGPRAWNTLPYFITDCSSSRTFKQYLKTYLFCLSFWAHNNTSFYDCVKRPSSSLCRLRRFKIVYFTLHICEEYEKWKQSTKLTYSGEINQVWIQVEC